MMKKVKLEKTVKKGKIILAVIAGILCIVLITAGVLFFNTKPCKDETCFQDALTKCGKATWTREDINAAWAYNVYGENDKTTCKVLVKLLKVNKGDIELEKLQGESMICYPDKTSKGYPEENMVKCTGLLKENVQEIIIQRMHNYLLENAVPIKQQLEKF
jgi:hypothetical protein